MNQFYKPNPEASPMKTYHQGIEFEIERLTKKKNDKERSINALVDQNVRNKVREDDRKMKAECDRRQQSLFLMKQANLK